MNTWQIIIIIIIIILLLVVLLLQKVPARSPFPRAEKKLKQKIWKS